MIETECIPFRETGYFSKLICDYLDQKPALKGFYGNFPSIEAYAAQINQKQHFPEAHRKVLHDVLVDQYTPFELSEENAVLKNVHALNQKDTYTVTTGHQLNLFSGPLYFVYKIVSVINIAKDLKAAYPDKHFVPVYWMATEDHDFAEINHANHYGGQLRWDAEVSGPVGRLETSGMQSVLDELASVLGEGKRATFILELFKEAYLKQGNLAKATRYFVHELFTEYGLVIIDADERRLKQLVVPHFKRDLFEQLSYKQTKESSAFLAEHYTEQVHVRKVNLFYIKDGLRERIERQEDEWVVLNTNLRFTKAELEAALDKEPECFSPNVVLRPLYQEVILPNLSYTGGGGELAYWLQLKQMFETYEVPFPMLHLRNSVLWIPKRLHRKMKKLELKSASLFQSYHELSNRFVKENSDLPERLNKEYEVLEGIYTRLSSLSKETDVSMQTAVSAQHAKQLKGLDNLHKKLLRAEKKRNTTQLRQLEEIKNGLFPNGSLQERYANFIAFYLEYGTGFIENLVQELQPFDYSFICIKDKLQE
jgi:bacillithiol biosynthesis cysteine-adding enzyme BshC